jgi:hypothetical protein
MVTALSSNRNITVVQRNDDRGRLAAEHKISIINNHLLTKLRPVRCTRRLCAENQV